MNLRMTLLAASLAALSIAPAFAAPQQLGAPTVAPSSPQQLNSMMSNLAAKSGLGGDHGFALKTEHAGAAGNKVTRLHHTFKGIRVFESESVVVTNAAGATVSETHADRRHGLGSNGFAAAADMNPKLAAKDAINLAVKAIAPNGTHMHQPSAELILFPIVKTQRVASAANKAEKDLNALDLEDVITGHQLAYLVKTRMLNGGKPTLHDTIVSAADGSVLKRISAMHNVVGVGKSQYNGQVPINTSLSGSTYQMLDATRGTGGTYGGLAITNANHGTTAGSIYTNTTNTWGDGLQYNGGSTTNANGQTAAVNALWGAMNTYDTLNNVLGWKALDNRNTAFYIAVHVNNNYDNAYYDDSCKCMFIGDGSSFYSLGSIDVIGHEMGHGVTAASSNLTYSGESGGLNESNSDITGDMVEAYARNGGTGTVIPAGNDWEVGKEIAKNGVALRHMIKPSQDGSSPDAWSSTLKNLDVHYSSGPNNRMFYFLSQGSNATSGNNAYSSYLTKCPRAMTGIGNDKAFRIWFNALTTRFTASTNYADARTKVIAAAQALYGVGSKEDVAVQRAYAAINVGTDVDEPGAAGCSATPVSISGQPASVSVAVGGTANFSVTATGGTAPYKYQWRRNGTNIAGATSATYSLANVQSTDNGAVFSVVVTDSATTPSSATSSNATLTVGTSTTKENLVNGGFESGTTPWAGSTATIGTWTAQPAKTGTRNAWLGGNGSAVTETLTQTVAIPSTATSATLSFDLHIDTAETTTTTAYDKLTVTLKNTSGTVLKTLATYSNLNKVTGYLNRSFDVTAYKGQTVVVSFSETEDSSLQTSFALDNVSLISK